MSSINENVTIVFHYDAYVANCDVGVEFKGKKKSTFFNEDRHDLQCLENKDPTGDGPKPRLNHNHNYLLISLNCRV